MNDETKNNIIVIMNLVLMFAFVGLAIHSLRRRSDAIEATLYAMAAIGFAMGFALSLYKLFRDRLGR